jgi:FAD/FMN-containing dehydrogenase
MHRMRSIEDLRAKIAGNLLVPGADGYDRVRRGGGSTAVNNRRPAIIVQAKTEDDVARAIEFARSQDIDLSVRSGGHDMLGASTTATGLLLDLSLMDQLNLDASTGVGRVAGGARSGVLFNAGAAHGLAPVLGMSANVGVAGLLLGGGIGWISGRFGAAVDHLISVDIVTADGRFITANERDNSDLFWAIRGGGGNFGVATAFTIEMRRLSNVLAGTITYRKAEPTQLMNSLSEILVESGDPLDVGFDFTLGKDAAASLTLCWSADRVAGERVVGRLRQLAPPARDEVKEQRLADFVGGETNGQTLFLRGGELASLSQNAIETIADVIERGGPDGCSIGLLHYMHGALSRVPLDQTPFIRPDGHILYNIVASSSGPDADPAGVAWACETWETLRPISSPRTYPNYLCEENEEAVRAAYGPHYDRLRAIKRCYDPGNIFRHNRNIRPAIRSGAMPRMSSAI